MSIPEAFYDEPSFIAESMIMKWTLECFESTKILAYPSFLVPEFAIFLISVLVSFRNVKNFVGGAIPNAAWLDKMQRRRDFGTRCSKSKIGGIRVQGVLVSTLQTQCGMRSITSGEGGAISSALDQFVQRPNGQSQS